MKVASYMKGAATLDNDRGPSSRIWGDCDWDGIVGGQNEFKGAKWFYDDAIMLGNAVMSSAFQGSIGQWSAYGAAGAFINDQALDGAVAGMGSDGDNEGLTLISSAGGFRMVTTSTLAPNQKLWFEASVGTSTIAATKRDDFVGLAIPALSSNLPRANYPITTTDDTLDATNGTFIGFHRKGTAAPTDYQFVFNLAGGTINYVTNLTTLLATAGVTLAANVPIKLGFVFDPNALTALVGSLPTARQTQGQLARQVVRIFAQGYEMPTFLTGLDVYNATATQAFPTGFMAPCVATMNQTASTPGSMLYDWIRVAQMPNS